MKIFCKYIIPILLLLAAISCDKTTVGYLFADNLTYTPDSIVVKAVLDALEGVQGTSPINYAIENVVTPDGDPASVSQFQMVRKGVIELPWNHTVPPGRYVISIRVSNEGRSIVKDSVYTVIVK